MKVGVFEHPCWRLAASAADMQRVELPSLRRWHEREHPLQISADHAEICLRAISTRPVNFLIDDNAEGLHFIINGKTTGGVSVRTLHDMLGVPLVSHFVDPVPACFRHLPPPLFLQTLMSESWIKLIFDQAQMYELQQFGVPNVLHMGMAARDLEYDTSPLPEPRGAPISFVGAQHNSYFFPDHTPRADTQLPGVLAAGYRADSPDTTFFDIYYNVYGMAEPPRAGDPNEVRAAKMQAYFEAKAFYNSLLWMTQRDRFVIFLKRQLGDLFEIHGDRWDAAYRLPCQPAMQYDAYLAHFRRSLINLNFISGNAETGLNLRCFEVTAAGGFLLCQHRPELPEFFEVGRECDSFRDERELLDKCRYYLEHPDRARQIARAGQQRTLGEHLYSHRLKQIARLVESAGVRESHVPTTTRCYTLRNPIDDCRRIVPAPDVILDCGAHIGSYAYAFRRSFPNAEIYAFEPADGPFAQLATVAPEIGVRPVQAAVSDTNGAAELQLCASDQSATLLDPLDRPHPLSDAHSVVGRQRVRTCTLDNWCRENGIDPRRVSILKMDIQGAELKAMAGATEVLAGVRAVLLEVGFQPYYKDMPLFEDIERFMTERGFVRYALYPSGEADVWGDALYVPAHLARTAAA